MHFPSTCQIILVLFLVASSSCSDSEPAVATDATAVDATSAPDASLAIDAAVEPDAATAAPVEVALQFVKEGQVVDCGESQTDQFDIYINGETFLEGAPCSDFENDSKDELFVVLDNVPFGMLTVASVAWGEKLWAGEAEVQHSQASTRVSITLIDQFPDE